nr:Phosphate import ATP-binding protein like [Ipomoea batatas]GMC93994.1 Phosphate import ATP-binding protein like [Ipomoea batatas]GMD30907.1 Phosphate import ATP-binding protein like [Ipomoea batatas]
MLLQGTCGMKMKQLAFMGIMFTVMLFIVYRTTNFQYRRTETVSEYGPSYTLKADGPGSLNLLAMPVAIKQKDNVNKIAQKFRSESFTIILFNYDGNVDGWWDLAWTKKAVHIVAHNQTKW